MYLYSYIANDNCFPPQPTSVRRLFKTVDVTSATASARATSKTLHPIFPLSSTTMPQSSHDSSSSQDTTDIRSAKRFKSDPAMTNDNEKAFFEKIENVFKTLTPVETINIYYEWVKLYHAIYGSNPPIDDLEQKCPPLQSLSDAVEASKEARRLWESDKHKALAFMRQVLGTFSIPTP